MSELARGLVLQEQGRLAEAEACFQEVLAREPDNDFVHSRLALCRLNQSGRKKHALDSIGEAIRLRADEPFYHAIKAIILADMRRGRESLVAADTAIGLNPEDSFSHAAKAHSASSLERWADSEKWSRRALALDADNSMAANLLAHALRMQGRQEEADVAVEQLLAADPEDSLAHVNAGWAALQRGSAPQAEIHFREALRLDPDSEMGREGLLEAFRARSIFYRVYLSYCFFMQRFTAGRQWLLIVGLYLGYQAMRLVMDRINPALGLACGLVWLALVLWVWLAPGLGNFLISLDKSARQALRRGERHQGWAVGGGLLLGIAAIAVGLSLEETGVTLAGVGLLASTFPASLAFGNESRTGRMIFGAIAGYVYAVTAFVLVLESVRGAGEGIHPLSLGLGGFGLVAALAATWLGNVRSLRLARVH